MSRLHWDLRLVKHPLYVGVALLVLPWVGFLFNTWLGAAVGLVMYVASRIFGPAEEAELARTFGPAEEAELARTVGPAWEEYSDAVKLPWS